MTRAREYYGQALIAGISVAEARHMMPGFIMDMFKQRAEYDARLAGHRIARRAGLIDMSEVTGDGEQGNQADDPA